MTEDVRSENSAGDPAWSTQWRLVSDATCETTATGLEFASGRGRWAPEIESGTADALRELLELDDATRQVDSTARIAAAGIALRLESLGFAESLLLRDGVVQARRRLTASRLELVPVRSDVRYALSRFTYLHRDDDELVLRSPLSHWRVALSTGRAAAALHELVAEPRDVGDRLVRFLADSGMLTAVDADGTRHEDRVESLRTWEFHDRLFHDRSRGGRSDMSVGGTARLAAEMAQPPLRAPRVPEPRVELPEPVAAPDRQFLDVLGARRSTRPEDAAISIENLSTVLHFAARAQSYDEDNDVSRRSYPTGGAIGELEIYVASERCTDLEHGLYRYDGLDHALARLSGGEGAVGRLLDAAAAGQARDGRPAVLLILASRFARVAWKYESIAYALILKNAGALLQSICLTAEAVGVAACPLGTGNSAVFARATGLPPDEEGPVAEITLG